MRTTPTFAPLVFLATALVLALETAAQTTNPAVPAITRESVIEAEKLLGLKFDDAKRDLMLEGLRGRTSAYQAIRSFGLSNSVMPAILFNPLPTGFRFETHRTTPKWSRYKRLAVPASDEDLAFLSVGELSALIHQKKLTSERLTRVYLDRLKMFGPRLECVITLTEELALKQARRADSELASGKDRGPLHGIPYGAKDLLATKGIRTTWGAAPYTNQVFSEDATVIRRLEDAGAVLLAKLTMGELAMGEVWFGGQTRNPWDTRTGSSGSSAGSACATSAGLVAFAIGTETLGSIVSPCTICGVTGLRPSYGRVSRTGAMALSWSMDKIGPICRTVEDCAMVFAAIQGVDGVDPTLYDAPFNYQPKTDLRKLRIGYLKSDFDLPGRSRTNDLESLKILESLGAKLVPLSLPKYPVGRISFLLSTEGAAAFDELTRSGKDGTLVRQNRGSWPNTFRQARFVPAVEYINANRIRQLLVQDMGSLLRDVDVYIAPAQAGENLLVTNLTGNPCAVVPNGMGPDGLPTSITFCGKLFGEADVLAVAKAYQDATDFHRRRPPIASVPAATPAPSQ
jgi:Asp-tRNA(Asn)/Glu-tRNA(Gln) amidotransferase A subunit family amidase